MPQERLAALFYVIVSHVKIPGVPGVRDVPWPVREIQEPVYLVVRVRTDDPVHIPDIPALHTAQIIVVLIVFLCHLHGVLSFCADAKLPQLPGRPRMDRVADLLPAGGRRSYIEPVSQPLFLYHVPEDELRHGGAADVAVAHEKHSYHILKSS